MLEQFAAAVGKAHTQLMEGAITYEEFYYKVACAVGNVDDVQRHNEELANEVFDGSFQSDLGGGNNPVSE